MTPQTKRLAGLGAVILLGYGLGRSRKARSRLVRHRWYWGATTSRRPEPPTTSQGAVICPAEFHFTPALTDAVKPGDFVAIRLADHGGTYTELVWAVVLSKGVGSMQVKLTGNIGSGQVKMPAVEKHGFDVGHKLLVGEGCAWEVFHSSPDGMALCGLFFDKVAEQPTPAAAAAVVAGDEVAIFVTPVKKGTTQTPAAGWDVPNRVWTRVLHTSKTGSILRVVLLETPKTMPGLNLGLSELLDITRDCIAEIRAIGST